MPEARSIHPGLFVVEAAGPRLLAGTCAACARLHFPVADVCPYCGEGGCSERRVGPAGRLWLYTVVPARPPGYRGDVPFGFGVVELEDGLRVVTRLTDARLDRLRHDLPVRLVVEPLFTDDAGCAVLSYAFTAEP